MDKVIKQSRGRIVYSLVSVGWLIYATISFLAPRNANIYHLSPLNLHLLQLTIVLPVLLIWLTAAYGGMKFHQYAQLIRSSPDGSALHRITVGLLFLICAFIVQTVFGVLPRIATGTVMLGPLVLLHNYLPMIMNLIAALYVFTGSVRLASTVKARLSRPLLVSVLVVFVLVGGWAGKFFYSHIDHTVTNGIPNFVTPGHWPFYTLALPYLLVWLLGLLSILYIYNYLRNVKGLIYRQAVRYLAVGTISALSFAVMLEMLTFAVTALLSLPLSSVLGLIYLILVLYAASFVFVAIGARKLSQIEEVQ